MSGLESTIKKNPLTKSHTVYKIGKRRLPSVTTVISGLGWKYPALMGWQRRELLAGNDPQSIASEAAKAGTLAHSLVENHFTGDSTDLSFFSEDQIAKANIAYGAFLDWLIGVDVIPLESEIALTHSYYKFGGTIDLLCALNGELALLDLKTSKKVYTDHKIQLAAYQQLVKHRYGAMPDTWILRIGREGGEFDVHHYPDLTNEWKCFTILVRLYKLRRVVDN